ncbi:lipase maturation factor family protein [Nannocystis pusilla]|uniref:lipase maturation factor family protein n=1 Tax=Nannocystis pusilla TaxID=889268 RepID=UPI003BF11DC6
MFFGACRGSRRGLLAGGVRASLAGIEVLDQLAHAPPELVWGLVARGIGVVYAIAFASLTFQVGPLAGREGVAPVAELMAAIRRDFSAPRRWLYFPGLLWLHAGDRWLRALPWLGLAAALTIVAGGPHTPLAFFLCWALYLSLDRAVVLVYPWDSLLLEAGFWAMFLPALAWAPAVAASGAPMPALAWVFRLLLFRVMFGFGKQKFAGSTRADAGFLKGFAIRQPLPTPFGWLAHRAPMWVHKAALALLFVVEVVLPLAIFVPGPASVVFALATAGLMLAIAATGNYGFFNVLTIALCGVCFDSATALAPLELFAPTLPATTLALQALIVLHTFGALLCLPLNTWASFTWTLWPWWERALPRALRWPIAVFRGLQPLRWLHAYGVFPPRSAPAIKMSPALEVTWDETRWYTLTPRWWPTLESSPPRWVAPHHPRFDHAIVYEATGFHEASVLRNLTGRWDPYGHARCSGAGRLMRRVLRGELRSQLFFGESLPAERGAPIAARVRMYMLEATTPAEQRASGAWWRRTLVGPHLPRARAEDRWLDGRPPPPESWAPEDWRWVGRSRLGPLLRRAAAGEDPHALVCLETTELTPADVDALWEEFVPMFAATDRDDWSQLPALVERVRGRWSGPQIDRFERLLGRYALLGMARCERLFVAGGLRAILGRRPAPLDVETHLHLNLLIRHVIGEGREAYAAMMREPETAATWLSRMSLRSGWFFEAVLRPERMAHQAQKFRMLASQVEVRGWPRPSARAAELAVWGAARVRRLWGAFAMIEFLRGEFREEVWAETPERWPRFELCADLSLRPLAEPDETTRS